MRQLVFKLLSKIEGAAGYARGRGYGTATIEQEVRLALKALKRAPRLAVDIGGSVGSYSAALRRRCPGVEVHLFEPSSSSLASLRQRFASDHAVAIVPLALSDAAGSSTLFSNKPGSGLASLSKRNLDHRGIKFDLEETVSTARFEDYWSQQLAKRPVDLAKIDVEGHELAVLQGFGSALAATSVVQFEFGGTNIDTRTFFRDFWYFFREHSFDIHRITPLGLEHIHRYRESYECFDISNYIAINRRPG